MSITPFILGTGRAGLAIAKSLACLNILQPELELQPAIWLKRGASLADAKSRHLNSLLCIANPHGLHAEAILAADKAGFSAILCEKPACVNLEQIELLKKVRTPVAVFHGYRQMWGLQTIKKMIVDQTFGQLISIEGRYWQASTAERSLQRIPGQVAALTWKDQVALSGEFDTYLDTGTHWIDAVSFLMNSTPTQIHGWRSYMNAVSPHRDSHVQVAVDFPNSGRAFGSISKTYHGADNHFEINVIGEKLSAAWEFLKPDEIQIGEGRNRRILTRTESK
jgi:predicted dehydrogenase